MAADPPAHDPAMAGAEAHERAERALSDALEEISIRCRRLRVGLHHDGRVPPESELRALVDAVAVVLGTSAAMRVSRDVGGWAR